MTFDLNLEFKVRHQDEQENFAGIVLHNFERIFFLYVLLSINIGIKMMTGSLKYDT